MKRGIIIGIIGILVIAAAIKIDSLNDETSTVLPDVPQAPEQVPAISATEPVSSSAVRGAETTSLPSLPNEDANLVPPVEGTASEQTSLIATEDTPEKEQIATRTPEAEDIPSGVAKPSSPFIQPPEFTVLRVNPEGDAVIAGRAMANAKVIIRKDDEPLGEASVDERGEWVFVPPFAIPPGQHRIDLLEVAPDGSEQLSQSEILVVVADTGEDIAGNPSDRPVKPLAMAVPRDGAEGPSLVLQAPQAPSTTPLEQVDTMEDKSSDAESKQTRETNTPTRKVTQEKSQIRLSNVDVTQDGKVHIVGFTEAGEALRLYIDNAPKADAIADEAGRFQFTPKDILPKGQATLRVDVVSPQGDVLARAEADITVPPVEKDIASQWQGSIQIKPGQNLWTIARQTYGRGIHYTIIFNANQSQIRDPNLIYPGQVFSLPKPEDLQQQ